MKTRKEWQKEQQVAGRRTSWGIVTFFGIMLVIGGLCTVPEVGVLLGLLAWAIIAGFVMVYVVWRADIHEGYQLVKAHVDAKRQARDDAETEEQRLFEEWQAQRDVAPEAEAEENQQS